MGSIDVKSKFYAEFRRFALKFSEVETYQTFKTLLEKLHKLEKVPICISYHDPNDGDLLPINNDDNYARAISMAKPLLRIIIQKKGDVSDQNDIYRSKNVISTILGAHGRLKSHPLISNPLNFRQVSAIIDVDVVPTTCRRVRLLKNSAERPLGFYIRDGTSVRVTSAGLEKIPGIFISRLVPGGLAESTGLLFVNDEVLEVNGIEVTGKTLDQVTDMMVANSHNLIITVKPANQRNTLPARPRRGSPSRSSQQSMKSAKSIASNTNTDGIIFI